MFPSCFFGDSECEETWKSIASELRDDLKVNSSSYLIPRSEEQIWFSQPSKFHCTPAPKLTCERQHKRRGCGTEELDLNDGSLQVQTRTVVSGALLADVPGVFAHSVLIGAVWTDRAVVSQTTRQMPFRDNFIPTHYAEQNVIDTDRTGSMTAAAVSLACPVFFSLKVAT